MCLEFFSFCGFGYYFEGGERKAVSWDFGGVYGVWFFCCDVV